MKRIIARCGGCFIGLMIVGFISSHTHAASPEELMAAAIRLKQAHIERSIKQCSLKGISEERCKRMLQITHKRELKIIARLKPAMTDPNVNVGQLNKEMNACYGSGTYNDLIICWARLADRLDDARRGVFLLKK